MGIHLVYKLSKPKFEKQLTQLVLVSSEHLGMARGWPASVWVNLPGAKVMSARIMTDCTRRAKGLMIPLAGPPTIVGRRAI